MNNHESDLELEMAFKNDFYALLYKHNAHFSDDDHPIHFFCLKVRKDVSITQSKIKRT